MLESKVLDSTTDERYMKRRSAPARVWLDRVSK